MSTAELVAAPPAPTPAHIGQRTAVEQSRAVAEVQAAIVVAQQCPRNVQLSIGAMKDSCAVPALAERAFFRYSRGGGQITGPSVHLARELARCWGNVQYGISELRRDDREGISEMQAWAWDVQTNTRSVMDFIVPHLRDKRGGPERLTDVRDIYENNANHGARRLREAIFAILPAWFTEEAKDLCVKTLTDGGGKPLAQRVADAIGAFGKLGVTVADIERKLGRASKDWTELDVATLTTVYRSLQRGETTREEEFPDAPDAVKTTTAELLAEPAPTGKPAKRAPAKKAEPEPEAAADAVATFFGGEAPATEDWPDVPEIPGVAK